MLIIYSSYVCYGSLCKAPVRRAIDEDRSPDGLGLDGDNFAALGPHMPVVWIQI